MRIKICRRLLQGIAYFALHIQAIEAGDRFRGRVERCRCGRTLHRIFDGF